MQSNSVVIVEMLDGEGHVWRTFASQMVSTNVERALAAIRHGYDMERTRVKVDGQVVAEPRRR